MYILIVKETLHQSRRTYALGMKGQSIKSVEGIEPSLMYMLTQAERLQMNKCFNF